MSEKTSSNKYSLRFKMLSIIFAICMVLGSTASILFELMVREVENGRLNMFKSYSETLGNKVAAQFFERYGDVQAFAENRALRFPDQKAPIVEALNRYVDLYQIYDLIIYVDAAGRFIASNDINVKGDRIDTQVLESWDWNREPWMTKVISGQFSADAAKGFDKTYVEDVMLDRLTTRIYGHERFGTSFSTEVRDAAGRLLGVLSARANFSWVENEFIEFYNQLRKDGLGSTELTLLDHTGRVLVDYDPSQNNGSTEVRHDFKTVLLKLNLANSGVVAAQEAIQGRLGAMYAFHARKQLDQAAGYGPIKSEKFLSQLGWAVLVRTSKKELIEDLSLARLRFYGMFFTLVVVACALAFRFSHKLSQILSALSQKLSLNSSEVAAASSQIANSSTELSEAANEQAASLQETVSSIDEIGAMVDRNAQSAKKSNEVSDASLRVAGQGQAKVREMMQAIEDISRSNQDIMQQMEQSNREFSDIIKVIEEIGNRTKVINDIVFQTKLLSFNASVEAARAGEHGKGFAVVAEEVGNLAQMSGNAAKEISALLDESIKKVESIVNSTKVKVEGLVATARDKVALGTKTAGECGEILENILKNVQDVNSMVTEIARASQEQAQGIREVTTAVGQLDQVTQQNAAAAQQASSAAEQLHVQSESMNGLVSELSNLIAGQSATTEDAPVQERKKPKKRMAKVLPFKNKKQSGPEEAQKIMANLPVESEEKKVVGANTVAVPLEDDPRFEDF